MRKLIREIKENSGCVKCGYNKCYAALDFHHLANKHLSINSAVSKRWSWTRIQKEIDKCIVLCKNCHAESHSN